MSATNHTTNYNLPQFIGTDKPTWLTDVNGALSTIDTQMKANADSATSASTSATTANTKIGTLASLDTTVKTDAVSAINEVNTKAGNAQSTANTAVSDASNAQTTANTANTLATELASFVNINTYTTYNQTSQFTRLSGSGNCSSANITVATNADKSLCKIYGSIYITSSSEGNVKWKLNVDTGLRPTSTIDINGILIFLPQTSSYNIPNVGSVHINTDGTIEFSSYNNGASSFELELIACVLWVKDFGDTPVQQ